MPSPLPAATILRMEAPGILPDQPRFAENVWRAPLVPAALAVTAGVLLDRFRTVPLSLSLLTILLALAAWFVTRGGIRPGLPLAYLGLAGVAFGAAFHHRHLHVYPADDIGHFAKEAAQLVRVRGVLDEEPSITPRVRNDPLQSFAGADPTFAVLRATALARAEDWRPVSGRARLVIAGQLPTWHVGDEVEVAGWLEAPQSPGNPGERDQAAVLRDQRIRAVLRVRQTPAAVTRLAERWPYTLTGWFAVLRGWGRRQLTEAVPEHAGLAAALLLGDTAALPRADWEKYVRTGVLHVLAISGQHLIVLAVFLWWVLRLLGVRQSRGAWVVGMCLLGYALLAGGRPPVLRAAVMVCVACGALVRRLPVLVPNTFALAWLTVLLLNPTDMFTAGCQLSFLATAVVYWTTSRMRREQDPLEQLEEESRPAWQRFLRGWARVIGHAYVVNFAVWLALTPLFATHMHLVPPAALVIGPPLTLVAAAALIFGFTLLPCTLVGWPLAIPLARLTSWSLSACDEIVQVADGPIAPRWYVGEIPQWWLWGCYGALLGMLLLRTLQVRWRWFVPAGAAWLCVGLVSGSSRLPVDEFRCTFLAVGHGGCTVLQIPDGRTLLYDTGAITGSDVTRRHVAPFLWHHGVRRIDELLISHADLDHFNGVSALLERFAVGRVTWTPSFSERRSAGVRAVIEELTRRGVPTRRVSAGDRLRAGEVTLDVLHPPLQGPAGNENARSLVLAVRYAGHTLLLTGDLEGPGLQRVLALPPVPVDVLMAPHHGSRGANTPELAAWARPHVVVSCQGLRANTPEDLYKRAGARYLDTARYGAITIRSNHAGLWVETFRTQERFLVAPQRDRQRLNSLN